MPHRPPQQSAGRSGGYKHAARGGVGREHTHTHELATRPSTPQLNQAYDYERPSRSEPVDDQQPTTSLDPQEEDSGMAKSPSLARTSSSDSLLSSSSSSSTSLPPAHSDDEPDHLPSSSDEEANPGRGIAIHPDGGQAELATPSLPADGEGAALGWRGWGIRALALLCACALSIGSHYAQYFLGPIKSRLSREMGTSNAQFSLLIASFSLNNTWTPLLGGLLTARLGTARSSIIATSLIFSGQLILLLGDWAGSVRLMAAGLFVFGLGISPLAVVQETIIVRFFSKHGLGVSLALGLLAGKGASFISAITSFPLSETFGPRAPFVVATFLAFFSWVINLLYLSCSAWFARSAGIRLESGELETSARRLEREGRRRGGGGTGMAERMSEAEAMRRVERKRRVRWGDVGRLGDVFWAYVGINVLCGSIWAPFMHLSANIIERRYGLTESDAGNRASLLMSGAIVLYPICGYLTDRLKTATVVHKMFVLSSLLTLTCYFWLCLPPEWTRTPTPALVAFGTGHGFATLLLVIIVPHLVPIKYVSSALGVHKALEQTGSTISQTLAGLLLDKTRSTGDDSDTPNNLHAISLLLRAFLAVNVVQLLSILGMWRLQVLRDRRVAGGIGGKAKKGYVPVPAQEEEDDDEQPAVTDVEPLPSSGTAPKQRTLSTRSTRPLLSKPPSPSTHNHKLKHKHSRKMMAHSRSERRRGRVFMAFSAGAIGSAWVLFMVVAWWKLDERAKGV